MRVKCINDEESGMVRLGEEYVVYGVMLGKNEPSYVIYDEYHKVCSIVPSHCFELVDSRFSKHWVIQCSKSKGGISYQLLHADWTKESMYLEWLVDASNPVDESVFYKTKKEMDNEYILKKDSIYQNDGLDLIAEEIGDGWVLCPICSEAWEVEKYKGVIQCPNVTCQALMNNPYAPTKQ